MKKKQKKKKGKEKEKETLSYWSPASFMAEECSHQIKEEDEAAQTMHRHDFITKVWNSLTLIFHPTLFMSWKSDWGSQHKICFPLR